MTKYLDMFFDNEHSINHEILKNHFRSKGLLPEKEPNFGNFESLLCPDCYAKGWNYQDFATKVECKRCKGAGRIFKEKQKQEKKQKKNRMNYSKHFKLNIRAMLKCFVLVFFHFAHAVFPIKLTEHKRWGLGK